MLRLAPVLRQIWFKKAIFEKKISIDNQQVTDGGRVLLNPASATKNGRISLKQRSSTFYRVSDMTLT